MSVPLAARDLAVRYDAVVAAHWRGEPVDERFVAWLASWWRPGPVGERHARPPLAVSPHGAAGRGIAWYETDRLILGVVRGHDGGCYVIPRSHAAADRLPAPAAGGSLFALPAPAPGSSPGRAALAAA